ncbi:MAG: J domain-containing protein [Verrucomicrobiales bacterium]|nr:J domain-containing protein [Verrucomicrobiales bacterium]
MLPFKILDLPLNTDDEAVRAAYRRLILEFPPESHPDQFKQIRNAFESIETEGKRITHAMGLDPTLKQEYTESPLETALSYLQNDPQPTPPPESDFYQFLKA